MQYRTDLLGKNVLVQSEKFPDNPLDSVPFYSSFDPVNADAKPVFHSAAGRGYQGKMTRMMPFPMLVYPVIFTGFSD